MIQSLGYKKMVINRGKQKNKNRDKREKGDDTDMVFTHRTPLMERVCDQIKHMKEGISTIYIYIYIYVII